MPDKDINNLDLIETWQSGTKPRNISTSIYKHGVDFIHNGYLLLPFCHRVELGVLVPENIELELGCLSVDYVLGVAILEPSDIDGLVVVVTAAQSEHAIQLRHGFRISFRQH